MEQDSASKGMLSPYRVLDLTDEKGLLCGKLLGDLGADVIKIERPCGDPARKIGPFYHDRSDPEKSLYWFALNTSKRGITLELETPDGQEKFRSLVKTADFVLESFPPGHMERLGLGYSELERLNPGIIMISITPFGQTGPYTHYRSPDIVAMALGGFMPRFGDPDRPPVRISHHPQGCLHGASAAAVAAMIALFQRHRGGYGQYVDVSIHESVSHCLEYPMAVWDNMRTILPRGERLEIRLPWLWPCKDGHVVWAFWGGPNADRLMEPLVDWMDKEGFADGFLKNFDWLEYDFQNATQDVVDRIEKPTRRFFTSHTKTELYEGAIQRRLQLFPLSTMKDILEDIQLTSRNYWVELEHPELKTTITYPGAFTHATEVPPRVLSRAPLIGEHNKEVFSELNNVEEAGSIEQGVDEHVGKGITDLENNEYHGKALEGIRIVEFGSALAGPLISRPLAEYGAEVIRVESNTRPELFRRTRPFKDDIQGLNRGGRFNWTNTGKLSVCINLSNPEGVTLTKKLISQADVVIENFAGGVIERLGLGYEELKSVKPDIIMLSTCMQGHTGPRSGHPGYGMQMSALTGFYNITGWPDREPSEIGAYTDHIAPPLSILAILSALDYHKRTGKGQYLDLSQYETAIHFIAPIVLDYIVNGRIATRKGNRCYDAAPHGAYRCRGEERWCAIAVYTEEEWQCFCNALGNPSWTKEQKFGTFAARKENEDELDRLVEEWTVKHNAEDVMMLLQEAGVGAGILQNPNDITEHDPQLKYRGFIEELEHPEVGTYRAVRAPFILSRSPRELRRAPLIGEHNEYALKHVMDLSDDEIETLIIEGVVD